MMMMMMIIIIIIIIKALQHVQSFNMYRGWTQTDYKNKHYNINQKDEET